MMDRIDTSPPNTPVLLIKDELFGVEQIANATLNIELSDETLRFGVFCNNSWVWVEDYSLSVVLNAETRLQTLQNIYQHHPFLSSNSWKTVNISFSSPHFTLLPTALFRKEYAEEYLKLVAGKLGDQEKTFYSQAADTDMVNIFGIDGSLADWFKGVYALQEPTFSHQTSALIKGTRSVAVENQGQPTAVLYFEDGLMNVVVMRQSELLLCNKFSFRNPFDTTYCILFILEQLGIQPAGIQVILYGEITPYSDSFVEITKFLPEVSFGQRPATIGYAAQLDDLPEHRYFSLYALAS